MTTLSNPHVDYALSCVKAYVPHTILDNWRVVGTTTVMVCLCLCPIIASAWDPPRGDDKSGEGSEDEDSED